MKLKIKSARGSTLLEIEVNPNATVEELKQKFYEKNKKFYPERQRFTLPSDGGAPKVVREGTKLSEYNLKDGDSLIFKDLGVQFSWKTVYTVEYLGPLLLYTLLYFRPALIYGAAASQPKVWQQDWAFYCWAFHFVKRILETQFIHKFSGGTLGFRFMVRNSMYYYFFGAYVGYYVNHPLYTPVANEQLVYIATGFFALFQVLNFWIHFQLSRLRDDNAKERKIPQGFWFNFVSFPNYFFEILIWVAFNVMTHTVAGVVFNIVGGLTMTQWAIGKHRRYRKMFDGKEGRKQYPKNRRAIIPFLI